MRESSYAVGGNVSYCSHYGDLYGGSLIELPYDPAIPILGVRKDKNSNLKKIHAQVHCSMIYNNQDMETT